MMFFRYKPTVLAVAFGLASKIVLTFAGNTVDYCYDDPDYSWHGKDCDEIAHYGHCGVMLGNGDKIGEVYCPVSCDLCDEHFDESYLMTSKDCYKHGEDIVATFANVDPHKSDAVAIWPYDNEDPVHYSTEPVLWKWLCYGAGNNCLSYYGEIVFNEYADGEWPLPRGSYIMILKRGGPLEGIKASDVFEVGYCGDHAPHPVSKPTPKPTYKPYPTDSPTDYPTYKHYPDPTDYPTEYPTYKHYPDPTDYPTEHPTYKHYRTDSPTEYPTYKSKPTPKPTPHRKPTPHPPSDHCTSSLTTDMECYDGSYDAVVVDFHVCDPHIKDWIGIFHASDDPDDLGEAIAWAWTACASMHDCEDTYDGESLDTNGYVEFIGLPDGEYRAHLIKHLYPSSSGYEAEASSGVFYVKDECVYY